MQIVTDGIVLREVKTGESDRILTILTRDQGVVSAAAKHSLRLKNKLSAATGLLCWSDFTLFSGKTMYTVDEASAKKIFFELRSTMEGLSLALYMAELTGLLAPEGEAAGAYLDFLAPFISTFRRGNCSAKHVHRRRALCPISPRQPSPPCGTSFLPNRTNYINLPWAKKISRFSAA